MNPREMDENFRRIQLATDEYARAGNLGHLLEAMDGLSLLRAEYPHNKAVLEPYTPRLKELSGKIRSLIRQAQTRLAEEYLSACREINRLTIRREACRNALNELVKTDGTARFQSPGGTIETRISDTLTLPKTKTEARLRLEELVRQWGLWEQSAILNARRLQTTLEQAALSQEQKAQIALLAPILPTVRLIGHQAASNISDEEPETPA